MNMTYPYTQAEADDAYVEWGANCGPCSLAFFLQIPIAQVRGAIPDFETKRYTSPTMMLAGLDHFGQRIATGGKGNPPPEAMHQSVPALVRIQWTGPWTTPGSNPKWAYRQTHWIVTYTVERQAAMVFDCNGGIRGFKSWREEIVPLLTATYPRADGCWFTTHVWTRSDR